MLSKDHWPIISIEALPEIDLVSRQIHQLSQLIAALGKYFGEEKSDDSHTNLSWIASKNWLIGQPIDQFNGINLGIAPIEQTLFLISGKDRMMHSFPGRNLTDSLEWVKEALKALGYEAEAYNLDMHYDIPGHPLKEGARAEMIAQEVYQGFCDLNTWSQLALSYLTNQFEQAHPIRIWPHHFDMATYIPLGKKEDDKISTSITAGVGIPDQYYACPYLYLNPWAADKLIAPDHLPATRGLGNWHTEDFISFVLPLTKLFDQPIDQQIQAVQTYFDEAVNAAHQVLNI